MTVGELLNEADDLVCDNILEGDVFGQKDHVKVKNLQFVITRDREFREYTRKRKISRIADVPIKKLLPFAPFIEYTLNMTPAVSKSDRLIFEKLYKQEYDRLYLMPLLRELELTKRELANLRPTSFLEELQDRDKKMDEQLRERDQMWRSELESRNQLFYEEINLRDKIISTLKSRTGEEFAQHVREEQAPQVVVEQKRLRGTSSSQISAPPRRAAATEEREKMPSGDSSFGLDRSTQRRMEKSRDAEISDQTGKGSPVLTGKGEFLPSNTTISAKKEMPPKTEQPAECRRAVTFAESVSEEKSSASEQGSRTLRMEEQLPVASSAPHETLQPRSIPVIEESSARQENRDETALKRGNTKTQAGVAPQQHTEQEMPAQHRIRRIRMRRVTP